jgi:hypothetical protein
MRHAKHWPVTLKAKSSFKASKQALKADLGTAFEEWVKQRRQAVPVYVIKT